MSAWWCANCATASACEGLTTFFPPLSGAQVPGGRVVRTHRRDETHGPYHSFEHFLISVRVRLVWFSSERLCGFGCLFTRVQYRMPGRVYRLQYICTVARRSLRVGLLMSQHDHTALHAPDTLTALSRPVGARSPYRRTAHRSPLDRPAVRCPAAPGARRRSDRRSRLAHLRLRSSRTARRARHARDAAPTATGRRADARQERRSKLRNKRKVLTEPTHRRS